MDASSRSATTSPKIRPKYAEFESATLVDTDIFSSQIPGGMLSNMESQLKAQGAGDRIKEVMAEVPLVKADAGTRRWSPRRRRSSAPRPCSTSSWASTRSSPASSPT
jgi:pyruvate/oxaloacetate carboxyltransferase